MFEHYVASLRFMPHGQVGKASYLDKNLFSPATTHVYVRVESSSPPPLQPEYQGPTQCLLNFSCILNTICDMAQTTFPLIGIKTAHFPRPQLLKQSDAKMYVLSQSFATTVCNAVVFCFLSVCTVHVFCCCCLLLVENRRHWTQRHFLPCDGFIAGPAVARAVALRRGFCRHCN